MEPRAAPPPHRKFARGLPQHRIRRRIITRAELIENIRTMHHVEAVCLSDFFLAGTGSTLQVDIADSIEGTVEQSGVATPTKNANSHPRTLDGNSTITTGPTLELATTFHPNRVRRRHIDSTTGNLGIIGAAAQWKTSSNILEHGLKRFMI